MFVGGEAWLVADMRQRCFDSKWGAYAVYAVLMAVLFVAGLPAVILAVLLKNRRRLWLDAAVKEKWAFLYEGYGETAWFWVRV